MYTSRHKIKDLTEDQREILKRNDEASVMELNKKIKEMDKEIHDRLLIYGYQVPELIVTATRN